jgi:hypothetical protein
MAENAPERTVTQWGVFVNIACRSDMAPPNTRMQLTRVPLERQLSEMNEG